jgi:hypothetical protein
LEAEEQYSSRPPEAVPWRLYAELCGTVVVMLVVLLIIWNTHKWMKLATVGMAALYYVGLHISLAVDVVKEKPRIGSSARRT